MLKKNILPFLTALLLGTAFMGLPAHAQNQSSPVTDMLRMLSPFALGQPAIVDQDSRAILIQRVGAIAQIFLGLLGLVMIILILYGGYLWLTARGNEDRVQEAQHTIQSAVIGAAVIIAAGAITGFVLSSLWRAIS